MNTLEHFRVTTRKARGLHGPSMTIKCKDCKATLTLDLPFPKESLQQGDDALIEIGGVIGTRREWREVLMPIISTCSDPGPEIWISYTPRDGRLGRRKRVTGTLRDQKRKGK